MQPSNGIILITLAKAHCLSESCVSTEEQTFQPWYQGGVLKKALEGEVRGQTLSLAHSRTSGQSPTLFGTQRHLSDGRLAFRLSEVPLKLWSFQW